MAMKPQRTQRKARKIDRKKVTALAEQGLSTTDIARHQNCAPSTIWRFMQHTELERPALESFKTNRADHLAKLHGKAIEVQHLALDRMKAELQDDDIASALTPTAKTQYLNAATIAGGTAFDKERLDRGQSTANHSILTKVLNGAVKELYAPQQVVPEAVKTEPENASAQSITDRADMVSEEPSQGAHAGPTTESEGA